MLPRALEATRATGDGTSHPGYAWCVMLSSMFFPFKKILQRREPHRRAAGKIPCREPRGCTPAIRGWPGAGWFEATRRFFLHASRETPAVPRFHNFKSITTFLSSEPTIVKLPWDIENRAPRATARWDISPTREQSKSRGRSRAGQHPRKPRSLDSQVSRQA